MQDVNHGAWIYNTLDKMPSHIILVAVLRFCDKSGSGQNEGCFNQGS